MGISVQNYLLLICFNYLSNKSNDHSITKRKVWRKIPRKGGKQHLAWTNLKGHVERKVRKLTWEFIWLVTNGRRPNPLPLQIEFFFFYIKLNILYTILPLFFKRLIIHKDLMWVVSWYWEQWIRSKIKITVTLFRNLNYKPKAMMYYQW